MAACGQRDTFSMLARPFRKAFALVTFFCCASGDLAALTTAELLPRHVDELSVTKEHATRPAYWYAMLTIDNPSNCDLKYELRWGGGKWKSFTVCAGTSTSHWHCYSYPNECRSPTPEIRFDASFRRGYQRCQYSLSPYAVERTCDAGKVYEFSTQGRSIDLCATN